MLFDLLFLLLKCFCNSVSLFYGHANKAHCCCCCWWVTRHGMIGWNSCASQYPFTARKLSLYFILNNKYKINLIRTLTCRCLRVCSSISCHTIYTPGVLLLTTWTIVVTRNRNKPKGPKDPITTAPKRNVFIVSLYLGLQSNFITNQLVTFPYKDRLNRFLESKVGYKGSCWDCDDLSMGKTKRRLHDR